MTSNLSYRSLMAIARGLLVFSALFLSIAVFLGVESVSRRSQTEALQARLLGQVELQTRLLAEQPSDRSVFPHVDSEIGYVLNPFMEKTTWQGPGEGSSYAINSLGLRGEEIAQKATGARRILLVGDSYVFGWKLRDQDRISAVMQAILAERLPSERIEVLTVAIPGWNVRSAAAFLERHMDVLQPDLIIWKVLLNDVDDVAGVIPPGILATWNSPQKAGHAVFHTATGFHKNLEMPAILERWDANLSAIASILEKYKTPLILLGLNPHKRAFFELLLERSRLELPTVTIPAEFTDDRSVWSISKTDPHPSASANRILALGLLGKMIRLESIPPVSFAEDEQRIVDAFRAEEARQISSEESRRFTRSQFGQVPSSFKAGESEAQQSVLYGLDPRTGRISKNGTLFVRARIRADTLDLVFEASPNPLRHARAVVFTVRNQEGQKEQLVVGVANRPMEITIPLPPQSTDSVYELSWQFDYTSCTSPVRCTSGVLASARFSN